MMDKVYMIREDDNGGCVLSSRCCFFLAETSRLDDAQFIRDAFRLRVRRDGVCPTCGKSRPMGE